MTTRLQHIAKLEKNVIIEKAFVDIENTKAWKSLRGMNTKDQLLGKADTVKI